MKKIVTIFIATLLIISSYAQTTDIRNVGSFSELSIKNAFEIVLTKGDKNEIKITVDEPEDIDKVVTKVSDGKLNIYTKKKSKNLGAVKIFIIYKELNGIEQSGATEISATNTIKTNKFYLKGSGATEVSLDLDVEELTIDFSGASEIKLDGNTNSFNVSLSGASELKASGLKSRNANINISGASEVQVYVTESIEGETSGASSIKVKGGVSVDKIKSSGISSISKG